MTQRTDTPPTWDERTQLATFLDYARDTARAKCEGVSAEDARKAPLPSSPLMTMCGLISHLRWVEYYWVQVVFLGEEHVGPLTEATDDDPDPEMRTAVDIPLPQLLAEYEEQSARYRRLVSDHDLNSTAKRPISDGRHVDLRWVILHLIEETSRHNGHLDIVRELVDGRTGV
ncbi:DinB family protein [Streptomyces sp. NPDC002917]|uniref:DinB family protein n=1 Tax=unclassified Streptomyces TaxID=2593676 RepID=UPI002E81A2D9|nr:DinB family protein [Streptomyces sp. NBC_00562]WTC84327.1 DinB family protein [Streptomyces sp. NBC_01653]WTD30955.1 DinB family protein [Streptomyces sp. NBC_01643]WTD86538.1 DinB family protein [Streptomyces sp. NBC_01637]WUC17619.1 DinB family protein [Streptomyces sp. NBC_00562]